jgi:L-histidine N-alpha-methyltransferase
VTFRLERLLTADELAEGLRREALDGLTDSPRWMRSRWLWDAHAAELYERIMELPDYYLPRAERAILELRAVEIAALANPRTVVELGSGSAERTTILLDALPDLEHFVAIDVSESALAEAGPRIASRYPELEVVAVVGDFERHLPGPFEKTLVVCLGSTVGALEPDDRAALLAGVANVLAGEGGLLLGLDLVKPVERILAAYHDGEGLSDALIANLLHVLNRELGADFVPERFQAEAVWNPELERMEMVVRSLDSQAVTLPAIDLTVRFEEGETLRTEISTKFRRDGAEQELAGAGLRVDAWWPDEARDFALCLARPVAERRHAA